MRNIEVKARLTEYQEVLEDVASLTGQKPLQLKQVDTYFKTTNGRLKLREEAGRSELIFYVRPDQPDSKRSDYIRVPVVEPDRLKDVLARALLVDVVVEKTRNLFFQDAIRIHVDEVRSVDMVDQADAERFVGRNPLTGQAHLGGHAPAHYLREEERGGEVGATRPDVDVLGAEDAVVTSFRRSSSRLTVVTLNTNSVTRPKVGRHD